MVSPYEICGTLCSVSRLWRDQFLKIYKTEIPTWKENALDFFLGVKRGRLDDDDDDWGGGGDYDGYEVDYLSDNTYNHYSGDDYYGNDGGGSI